MTIGTFFMRDFLSFVVYCSVLSGSFSRVITAVLPASRKNDNSHTELSRYPPPLFRKSRMRDVAHEAERRSRESRNSSSVCSQKKATSIYQVDPDSIISAVDGISIVSRVTSVFFVSYFSP